MIANPVILGKLMHEIVQKHLLNKKHFKHDDYVEEVLKLQMAETEAELKESANRIKEQLLASAELGNGMAVTPEARELCYAADNARHQANADKYGEDYTESLRRSRQPHLVNLAEGITDALRTLDRTLSDKGEGHDGYKVADFNVDQSVDDALTKFGPANPAHAQQAIQKQVVTAPNGQTYTLQNPYTHASQEFLRHHLLKDFEGTMTRNEDVDEASRKLRALVAAAPDKATKAKARALMTRLQEVNAAATGAILKHIRPGQYKRHGVMADLHEQAKGILSDTHSAKLSKGSKLTPQEAELDRAKAKVAYHVMKHLADDVHFEMPPTPKKGKLTQAQQQATQKINAAKDSKINDAATLLSEYRTAYQEMQKTGNPQKIIDLAAKLTTP